MRFPVPEKCRVAEARRRGNDITFVGQEGQVLMTLTLKNALGRGAYGITYSTNLMVGTMAAAVKIIRKHEAYTTGDVATEVICQIIATNATDGLKVESEFGFIEGPFAPRVFLFAEDIDSYYIVSERCYTNFIDIVAEDSSVTELKESLIQICLALQTLQEKIQFNHRDFKPDNIMFSRTGGIKIIDYGFCCLKYGNMTISSGYDYAKKALHKCFSKSRDLNALLYFFINYTKYKDIPCPLKRVIRSMIFSKSGDPVNWKSSYTKLNMKPELPNLFPENALKIFGNIKFAGPAFNVAWPAGCSEISPEWAASIVDINEGILTNLKTVEIATLDKYRLIEFLKAKRSTFMINRVIRSSTDPDLIEFCKGFLQNINGKAKKNGGKRKTRKL
jgi:hypothetical protein